MARWRLTAAHYLNIGEEWEYEETDQITGRRVRTKFKVPTLLDPKDGSRWTNREGDIVVCLPGQGHKTDYEIQGGPTPDMEPVDEEAEAITAKLRPRWESGPDTPGQDFGERLIMKMQEQIDAIASGRVTPMAVAASVSENAVTREEFAALQEQLAMLMARNAELEAETQPPVVEPKPAAERRI